jgi:hypothetical protein
MFENTFPNKSFSHVYVQRKDGFAENWTCVFFRIFSNTINTKEMQKTK